MENIHSKNKLLFHLDRVSAWQEKRITYPILVEFDLTNRCNNLCPLCPSANNRDKTTVNYSDAKKVISELSEIGVKAIILAGGGEPTCNPYLEEIIQFIRGKDIEVGINTNAYKVNDSKIETIVRNCTWARISWDAHSPEIYQKTHGMNERAYNEVLNNTTKFVSSKKRNNSGITIGVTYLLGKDTLEGIYLVAKRAKELGVDYIRFRPLEGVPKLNISHEKQMLFELKKAKRLNDSSFSASYREDRVKSEFNEQTRESFICYATNFMAMITADLRVYPCCVLRNNKDFCIGDLNQQSFRDIWQTQSHDVTNISSCTNPCQFEGYNNFLNMLKRPISHRNFL